MKFAKRLAAFLVVVVMLSSFTCLFASADGKLSYTKGSTYTIASGVTYTNLTMTSGQNNHATVSGVAMEFNPKDGYIPLTFMGYAGNRSQLSTQYNIATGPKYGYDVVGAVNGSYFTLSKGGLDYANISNGKVTCAHVDQYNREVVAFDKDGNMKSVWSKLEFKLFAKGVELPNAIYAINKWYDDYKDVAPNAVYYYDTSCGTYTDTEEPGYEIVCQKVNNTDLRVGKPLAGKVLEVKANACGTKFETNENVQSDKFVLYVKSTSNFANTLKNLKAGDDISIQVNETNAAAKSTMENALSTITNVGWLVKNGVDQTRIQSEIGSHGVTMQHRQTVFGQKPDGTYIFLTTEGNATGLEGSLTLRDAADYFISQGCTNVIRMDGGGSSGMYVKNKAGTGSAGYTQTPQRAVADTILIVKKSSIKGLEPEPPVQNDSLVYGKQYTSLTTPNRGDVWDDDGKRLTNGAKGQTNVGESGLYSAWKAPTGTKEFSTELLFDLGSAKKNDTYKAYLAGGNWGVALPKDSISMSVYVSDKRDSDFKLVASAPVGSAKLVSGTGKYDNTWSTYTITAEADGAVTARYVKLVFSHRAVADRESHIWLDEVEIFNYKTQSITPPADPDFQNVALSKDYTGGEVSSAGSYSANLTDGQKSSAIAYDNNWFGLYYNKGATTDKINAPDGVGTIIVDLEEVYNNITDVKVHVWNHNKSGIESAKSITAYFSEDGETYGDGVSLSIPAGDDPAWATATVDGESARYVKFVIETKTTWTFLNEIEVIADVNDIGGGSTVDGLGDVDEDGDVDATDYILVKRAVLKNYTLTDKQSAIADIDADGDVDATDYVLVKRIVLGTYKV